jgi:hypothetical protein
MPWRELVLLAALALGEIVRWVKCIFRELLDKAAFLPHSRALFDV